MARQMTFKKNIRCCSNCTKVQSAMQRKLECWTSSSQSIFDIPPLQTQTLQISPQKKSQKR